MRARPTATEIEHFKTLKSNGRTMIDIALITGWGTATIWKYLKPTGLIKDKIKADNEATVKRWAKALPSGTFS
jgi:hypothetical protein